MTSDTTDRVLAFLRSHIAEHGLAPTHVEIAEAVGFSTPKPVDHHLKKLARLGLIERTQDTSRNIKLVSP